MPYHVKSTGAMGTGTIYYEGGDSWTQSYADRKQYSNKSDADARAATTVTRVIGTASMTYTPEIYENATVVTE